MDFAHLISKFIHIACGGLVLLFGLLQMLLPKGGKLHRAMGTLYYWLMLVICITALPPSIYFGNWFLASVSLFAFYLVYTGKRYAANRLGQQSFFIDKLITVVAFAMVAAMYVVGVMFVKKGSAGMSLAPFIFGSLILGGAIQDAKYFFLKQSEERYGKMQWYFMHIARMIGSYIAAITAFVVNVQPFGPHWIHWVLPTVLGTFVIVLFSKYYKRKFKLGKYATAKA